MPLDTRQLTVMHRRQQLALRKATFEQMRTVFPALKWDDLDGSYPQFAAAVGRLVVANRRTSAGLAAVYLRAFRVASGLNGDVQIVLPDLPPEQFQTALRVTSLVAAKKSSALFVAPVVAMGNALTDASGSMARLVLNAGRDTIMGTIANDTAATGYRRVLGGGGCDFCKLLAGRGTVYKNEGTADFAAHDHCGCSVEPAYGGGSKQVRAYTASARFKTQEARDVNNARIRAYLNNA